MIRVLLVVMGAVALLTSPLQAQAQVPSAADFATRAFLNSPEMSPDGTVIAAVQKRDAGDIVAILNAAGGLRETVDLAPYDVYDLNWAGNRRLLISVEADGTALGQDIRMTRLIIYDLDEKIFRLADSRARGILAGEVLWADPAGKTALVASQESVFEYPMVRQVDLATGDAQTVEKSRPDVWDWLVDSTGVVRMGLAFEDQKYKIYHRERAGDRFKTVRGKFNRGKDDDEAVIDTFYFSGASNRTLVLTNGPTGRFALYDYDLDAGELGQEVFAHASADIDGVIRGENGEVMGVYWHDTRQRIHWLDPEMKTIQADLDAAFPNKINIVKSFSADRKKLLVFTGGADDPGQYLVVDLAARGAHLLYQPYEKVPVDTLSPVKAVEYRARDGLTIPAFLTLPKDKAATDLPLVIMPHGGPFARDTWEYDAVVQYLASRGYAVFQPQFRGSTGYGRDFVDAGAGQWGRAMQDDLNDGLDWLAAQGTIDPNRVCIVGSSYGGYAAMWGAIRDPERYRCAASFAGVSDLPAMLKEDKGQFSAKRYYRDWRAKVAGEMKRKDLDVYSPVDQAARLKVPLLLAHGDEDDNVPPSHTTDMVAALEKAGIEVDSIVYPDIGHGIYYTDHFEDWLTRLGALVAEHNPS